MRYFVPQRRSWLRVTRFTRWTAGDHGGSDRTRELSYALMSEDTARFIQDLNLDRPVLVGFSDGGIIGLTVAFRYPALLSRLVVCGANTTPEAMNGGWLLLFKLISLFTRNRKLSLVLTGAQHHGGAAGEDPNSRPRSGGRK